MKKIVSILLAVLLLVGIMPTMAFAVESEVPEGYIGVYDIEDLYCIRYGLDKNYILMADIDMTEDTAEGGDWDNGYGWAPIGEDSSIPFTGIFDGNGHTIKGMQINEPKSKYVGLFGYLQGDVSNLTITDVNINPGSATTYIGSLAGYSKNCTLENLTVTAEFENESSNGETFLGTVVGYDYGCTFSDLTVRHLLTVTNKYSGGVSGYSQESTYSNIKVNGTASQTTSTGYLGGVNGYAFGTSFADVEITETINQNNSDTSSYSGGAVGHGSGVTLTNIKINGELNCTAVSNYYVQLYVGGIAGYLDNTSVSKCVNNSSVTAFAKGTYYSYYTTKCYAGGISGYQDSNSIIENSYNIGDISSRAYQLYYSSYSSSSSYSYSGGIVGYSYGTTKNCYNTGTVASVSEEARNIYTYSGGIAGYGNAECCINLGSVTGKGGTPVISSIANSTVKNSYYLLGTADHGIYNTTDTATTATVFSESQKTRKIFFGYLDFDNVWFIDTSTGVMHPQLINNPEVKSEHTHQYTEKVTEPTCTGKGYTTYTCACGDVKKDNYTDALGHNYGDWAVTTAAGCTTTGVETRTCSRCSATETRDISATGHSFGEWTVTTPATESAKGVETRYCANCDATETREIPKLDHTHKYTTVVTAPTCTEQGYTTHTCSCGDSYVDTYVNATGHSFGSWQTTKAATCTAKGSETRTCSKCTATETRDIAAKGHSYTTKVTAPTCTAQGYTTHTCSACGDTYKDTYTNATGHKYTSKVTKEATCTATGVKTFTCSCGDSYTETINALGHNYKTTVTKPTCTEKGYTTHKCSRCGDSYVDSYVNAAGHKEGEWKVTKPATTTSTGIKTLYCSVCGAAIRTEVIPKIDPSKGKVKSVSIGDVELNYKGTAKLNPIIDADSGIKYTVTYKSSDNSVASVDNNGNVKGVKSWTSKSATITCTVTDEFGNVVTDTCKVTCGYAWWQWIIGIVLFGWIWY